VSRRRAVYIDGDTPGLELRVSPEGRKSWSIRYRPKGGERKRETTYPAVSLAAARQRAKDIGAAAAKRMDLPAPEQRKREEQRKADNRRHTVGDLIDEHVECYCKPNQRIRTLTARMFESHVKPAIGRKPLKNDKGLCAQVNRVRSQRSWRHSIGASSATISTPIRPPRSRSARSRRAATGC
jgi:Arm DNA-binding domain